MNDYCNANKKTASECLCIAAVHISTERGKQRNQGYLSRPAAQHFFRITINLSQQGIPQFHILQIMNFPWQH